ncbi:aminodeoxychorismate lyase [Marinobacterium arenosum]|uniref:aminodeoxychorismate lyase n=1 Tax=Marinobacterium arenosum TaxID=2862496 RepID=UPI001C9675E0|nr:aminodeoxychorismate lyase [Marinobacterium arenosum]MBY4677180.1 aminodeoxychorismate lyase [Marinobacterium arenosum]
MKTWLNGQPAGQISLLDRGLAYGDGLFETLRIDNGRPLWLAAHLARLTEGLQRLGFPLEVVELLKADLQQIPMPDDGVLKLTITRGAGGRGYRLPEQPQCSRIIALGELPQFVGRPAEQGVRVRHCQTGLAINPALAGLKHLNRLEQVMARQEWQSTEIAEGLVCDLDGFLVEGTMSNLFWWRDGVLYTPDLSGSGVSGIIRNQLLQIAERHGIETCVGRFRPDQLASADELFICNSLIDIWPVVRLDEQRWPIGSITRQLQQWLQQESGIES